ncbi:hypothetical protein [Bradyrhizobium aeschynomenes]|uniref:hypothetical protein n=1 Tax=Bradyrhizobium aeschynomenes TaxID=2734909 RepID=UPI001552E4D2|nr:hypothetical protein [Bradyrhizobium aeschynomenes]NPV21586.1 hypothetical protein [Bradyrhizobium aeschynomenes]
MLRRAILLSVVFASLGSTVHATAGESAGMAAVMQSAMASLRTAASYGRTGNIALAQIELDDARRAWAALGRIKDQPAHYSAKSLKDLLTEGDDRLRKADASLAAGDGGAATADIAAVRQALHVLRRQAGVVELGDCVFELRPAMDDLHRFAADFAAARATAAEVNRAGEALRAQLQRCNGLAAPDIAGQAEFRRLIDGAATSAQNIGRAAHEGDTGLVHRYEIELQSFVNLLDFRFG